MANYFKAVLTFNNENLGKAVNVYYMEDSLGISSDTAIRFQMNAYLEAIYAPLQTHMSEGITLMDCPIYEVDGTGATIRSLGTIAPDVEGG